MSVLVHISVGVGFWQATTTRTLVACPHVGDSILIGEHLVTCDRVTIGKDAVWVYHTRHFTDEHMSKELEAAWAKYPE